MSATIYQDIIRDHRNYIILLIYFRSRIGQLSINIYNPDQTKIYPNES